MRIYQWRNVLREYGASKIYCTDTIVINLAERFHMDFL